MCLTRPVHAAFVCLRVTSTRYSFRTSPLLTTPPSLSLSPFGVCVHYFGALWQRRAHSN